MNTPPLKYAVMAPSNFIPTAISVPPLLSVTVPLQGARWWCRVCCRETMLPAPSLSVDATP